MSQTVPLVAVVVVIVVETFHHKVGVVVIVRVIICTRSLLVRFLLPG